MFMNARKYQNQSYRPTGLFVQRTLRNPISCSGIGLHSGNRIYMTLKPAAPNTGIIFRRIDELGNSILIPAHVSSVSDTKLCSCIGNSANAKVATVEHLMASFHALGIDNAEVEINGPEVPAMDGSAGAFVFLIECAGIINQDAPKYAIRVLKEVSVVDGNAKVTLSPNNSAELNINFEIDFAADVIGKQEMNFKLSGKAFKKEIAKARTFGFAHEVEQLRSLGLAKGGSLENAVVIDENGVVNEDGLRYNNEFVRHKILDAVGDLYLSGHTIIGDFKASYSGHAHTYQLVKKLLADKNAYELVCLEEINNSSEKKLFDIKESLLATA
ncbi:MAG: UDP-3-O-acyl-N-acetylglucosamine deacetylase [Alphaproteobacteria bacterium]